MCPYQRECAILPSLIDTRYHRRRRIHDTVRQSNRNRETLAFAVEFSIYVSLLSDCAKRNQKLFALAQARASG